MKPLTRQNPLRKGKAAMRTEITAAVTEDMTAVTIVRKVIRERYRRVLSLQYKEMPKTADRREINPTTIIVPITTISLRNMSRTQLPQAKVM